MDDDEVIDEKVSEILLELEDSKREELEKVIATKCGTNNFFVEHSREDRVNKIKEQLNKQQQLIEDLRDEIARLNNIDKLDELPSVKDHNLDEIELADKDMREKVANRVEHLADKIKEGDYLSEDTVKTIDFYREQLISRCLKEEDFYGKSSNL
ncbi:hypothetical protein [Halanaerobacter jeridensis]|uniref:Ribonuclease HII n=1 Tax=Halanaerobacter jeridensis TaxID=706427 RepID=A0A938XQM1_9FIRM|nr:hypothetical protein [Halanaerobacter jeridensis]MBM7555550.1 ribonuclease HII [Halanaerobacter jeridensis]